MSEAILLNQPLTLPGREANLFARFVRTVLLPFLITRLVLASVALWAVAYLPPEPHPEWPALSSYAWLNVWSHWDAIWYLDIAKNGYQLAAEGQCNVTFAPLLPMLMRGTGWLLGGGNDGLLLAGLIWSNLALLVGLHFLWKIARDSFDESTANRAVIYALVNPATLFLSAVYPMSLFLAAAAATLYYAQRKRWRLAAAIACLAPLARPDGVLLVIPLAVELAQQCNWQIGQTLRRIWILTPLAVVSSLWPAYQWLQFGDPLTFIHAQSGWAESSLITLLQSPTRANLFGGILACYVLGVVLSWRKLRPAYAVYATVFLLVMLFAGRYWSIIRFLTILFPAYIALASLSRLKLYHAALTAFAALLACLFMVRFALGHWVA